MEFHRRNNADSSRSRNKVKRKCRGESDEANRRVNRERPEEFRGGL